MLKNEKQTLSSGDNNETYVVKEPGTQRMKLTSSENKASPKDVANALRTTEAKLVEAVEEIKGDLKQLSNVAILDKQLREFYDSVGNRYSKTIATRADFFDLLDDMEKMDQVYPKKPEKSEEEEKPERPRALGGVQNVDLSKYRSSDKSFRKTTSKTNFKEKEEKDVSTKEVDNFDEALDDVTISQSSDSSKGSETENKQEEKPYANYFSKNKTRE